MNGVVFSILVQMDIRTKLVFALVAVALGTMVALAFFMNLHYSRQFRENRIQQLDGLAESLEEGMVQIASGWEDRVRLIASRTELREILRENNLAASPEERARIGKILNDAGRAGRQVGSLAVYDVEGDLVASAGWGTEDDLLEHLSSTLGPEDEIVYQGTYPPQGDQIRVGYAAALTSDGTTSGELVGELQVRLNAGPLARLNRSRVGLGGTGEILIAVRDIEGQVRVLTGSFPDSIPAWSLAELRGPSDPISLAMSGLEGPHSEGIVDADGEPVWAAVRYLQETDWGLVVKIDVAEGRRPEESFREGLTAAVINLAALAILFGTILGLRFAKPIHELANAAGRIKDGDLSVRAPVTTRDEVGLLAKNFNQMAEELEQQVSLMKEFQNYFDLSRDMLCIAGTDGYFKRVNPAFERVLGWTTEELLAQQFLDFVHPDDLKKTQTEIDRLAQGLPTISFENRYMCFDGSEKILAWTAHPEPESGLIYAIARDVTDLRRERVRVQERIAHLRGRLEEAEAKLRGEP